MNSVVFTTFLYFSGITLTAGSYSPGVNRDKNSSGNLFIIASCQMAVPVLSEED